MSAWPSSPAPNTAKITPFYPTLVSTSQSLKQQVRSRGGQRWKIELGYQNLPRASSEAFEAFVMALRGQYNTCTLVVPGASDAPQGTWPGSPVLNGANQSGRSILLRGFTAGQTGVAKAGDYVTFAGDLKVYKVVADANSDGSGLATLSIEPALMITSLADGAAVTSTNVAFTVAATADTLDFALSPPAFRAFTASFMERV